MAKITAENGCYFVAGILSLALIEYIYRQKWKGSGKPNTAPLNDKKNPTESFDSETDSFFSSTMKHSRKLKLTDSIENELFSRNAAFFGVDGQSKIRGAFVIVVGLGGVGSHCAHMLARSGVRKLKVIDFDQVTLSSLNRHATASFADVGRPKAEVLRDCLQGMAPACEVIPVSSMFQAKDAFSLLLSPDDSHPDFVVDAIDDVNTKIDLLLFCLEQNLKVVSALGAGAKADPTRLHLGTMADAVKDPLASKLRWRLKKHNIDPESIPVLFSSELSRVDLLPLTEEQLQNPEEFGLVDNFRVRTIPVLGTMPALFGQALAAFVLCELAGKPFKPQPGPRLTTKLVHKMQQALRNREIKVFNNPNPDIDAALVEFIVCHIWRQRCAITGNRLGGPYQLLVLTRWDRNKGLLPNNLVLLMPAEAKKLEEIGHQAFSQSIVANISHRLDCFEEESDWF